jgi:Protein of unknown function (DUF3892)
VRMSRGGNRPKHIEAVRWEHRGSPEETGESTVEEMIDWIANKDGFVHVRGDGQDVQVWVVRPDGGSPYIRTTHDPEELQDDLLSLPRYGVPPGATA